jgi:hypothetical protein
MRNNMTIMEQVTQEEVLHPHRNLQWVLLSSQSLYDHLYPSLFLCCTPVNCTWLTSTRCKGRPQDLIHQGAALCWSLQATFEQILNHWWKGKMWEHIDVLLCCDVDCSFLTVRRMLRPWIQYCRKCVVL